MEATFRLQPVSLAVNYGYGGAELRDITRLVEEHCEELLAAYIRVHGRR